MIFACLRKQHFLCLLAPPLTGCVPFNPWSDFNISGQFVCETFGLIAPGMPQTAGRIGLNYTRVTISGEPAQATQLFDAMIATAFLTGNLDQIIEAGLAAVDPKSAIWQIVTDVRAWHRQHPNNWRTTRRLIKDKYSRFNVATRDSNGYELNTASTIAALLYGRRDYIDTSLAALQDYPKVLGVLFYESNTAAGEHLRRRALAAGLKKPEKKIKIW